MAVPIWLDRERMARRGDKPMAGNELIDEYAFLLRAGVERETAAEQLGHTHQDLYDIAYKLGRKDDLPKRPGRWDSQWSAQPKAA